MIKKHSYKTAHGTIAVETVDTGIDGKTLFVTAAIHGNEQCGTRALETLTEKLETGEVKLVSGKLVFVKICNPLAYQQDRRFSEGGENLNRVFKHHSFPSTPEQIYANTLIEIVNNHIGKAQDRYWLDLHSYYDMDGKPFVIVEYSTDKNLDFAKCLGVRDIFLGWNELYSASLDELGNMREPCTIDYAQSLGISGLTIECGGHKDSASIDVAYNSIIKAMGHLGLTNSMTSHPLHKSRFIQMEQIIRKPSDNWTLAQNWRNLDFTPKGTVLAINQTNPDADRIQAPNDCLILLPSERAEVGTEWFYVGKSLDI
jgi:predicted deacylase